MEKASTSFDASHLQSQIYAEEMVVFDGYVENDLPNTTKKKSVPVKIYRLMKREDAEALGISLQEGSVTNPNESTTVITRQTIRMDQSFPLIKVEETSDNASESLDDSFEETTASSDNQMAMIFGNENHPELKFGCGSCPKRFRHPSHLRRHEKGHSGERPFRCENCPKAFLDASTLLRHRRTHSALRPYVCVVCAKAFAAAGALRRHATMHDPAQRRFPCAACDKRFPDGAAYRKHLLTHEGVRAHACDTCGKRFFHVGDLNGHRKTHEVVKPFNCQHCGRQFVKQSNFGRHMLIHEGDKRFECLVCRVSYNFQSSLTRHLLTHVPRTRTDHDGKQQVLVLHADPEDSSAKVTLRSIRKLLGHGQGQLDEGAWIPVETQFQGHQSPERSGPVQIFHETGTEEQVLHATEVVEFHETQGGELDETEAQEIHEMVVQEFYQTEGHEDNETEVHEYNGTEAVEYNGTEALEFNETEVEESRGTATEVEVPGNVVFELKVIRLDNGQLEIVTGR